MTNLVFLFGRIAEVTGQDAINMENVPDTDTVKLLLEKKYPALKNCSYVFAINRKFVNGNCKLNDGDEISLLPPFAGG